MSYDQKYKHRLVLYSVYNRLFECVWDNIFQEEKYGNTWLINIVALKSTSNDNIIRGNLR